MTAARRLLAGALITVTAPAVACWRSRAAEFYGQVFTCDIAATGDVCGTTSDGRPMTCYAVGQLGGQDFCAPACDGSSSSAERDGTACVGARARVETCRPHASATDPAAGCPAGLSCYRTDLVKDEGLCLNVPLCTTNEDCADPARRVCAGALLRSQYPDVPLATDHLYCLQAGCSTSLTACPSGESCLPVVFANGGPDICVPNCDGSEHCPPNFACSRRVSGPGAPLVCVPGLPGYRCAEQEDCFIGTCEDSGLDFRICTIPCKTDRDCMPLISLRDVFVCAHEPSDGPGHCVAPGPFAGAPCLRSVDCPSGLSCFTYSPYQTFTVGECRLPCGPSGDCPVRGGLPHVCLGGGEGGCYPGRFGLPCTDSSQCMAGFSCLSVTNELAVPSPVTQSVCTIPCAVDADCDGNPWTSRDGYCGGGLCQLAGAPGNPCQRDDQCRTDRCQLPPAGNGSCLPEPTP